MPSDLGPMLEHFAIVQEMVRACGHARPDLSNDLGTAWQAWLRRNWQVRDALETAKRLSNSPEGKATLYLFNSLQTALEERTKTLDETGNTQYTVRCDGILQDIRSGHLDYSAAPG
jgi:hypothetical protein